MASIKDLSKDTLIYGVGTVLQKIIGIVLLPFYTRALIPAQYGVLDTLSTLTFFLSTIFGLGLAGATSRYFFIAEGEDEKKKLLYTSATIRLISYSIPAVLLIIFSSEVSVILFDSNEYSPVIIATAFLIYFSAQQAIQSQIFRFYREPVKFTFVTIIKAIIHPISGILLVVVLQWGVLGATLANLITSAITLTFGYLYFTRKKYLRQFSWFWAKKMLKFGFPLIFASILGWVNSVSDRFFLLHYQDLSQIGLYSIGSTFSQPILLVNSALTMAFGVILMSLYSEEKENDKPKTKSFMTNIWFTYLALAIPIAAFTSIFSYDLVNFITTPSYIGGILAIPFLLFSHILDMGSQITGNGMTLKEQSKPYFWILLIAAGTNFGLNFYFVPNFGFVGAAITTIMSNVVYFLISYYWSQKVFYIKRNFFKPAIYFLICLSIAIFFPFYELKSGVNISYLVKTAALILVLTFPFIFKMADYGLITNLYNNLMQKIKG